MSDGVVVVTGGASGIGLGCAKAMAQAHASTVLIDINDDTLAAAAADMKAAGIDAHAINADVSDPAGMVETARQVEADIGPVRSLVTSAGILENATTVMEEDLDVHARVWDINYHGTVYSVRAFATAMIERRAGSILTGGSTNSYGAMPLPAYGPSKTAILRLTQILAVELGRFGIRVNGVAPTYVLSPAIQARIDSGDRDPEKIRKAGAIDTFVYPEDIGKAAAFLCSDQASVITGCMMPVDAGWVAANLYRSYAGGVPWEQS